MRTTNQFNQLRLFATISLMNVYEYGYEFKSKICYYYFSFQGNWFQVDEDPSNKTTGVSIAVFS